MIIASGFDHDLTAGNWLGPSPTISTRLTELGLDHFHTDRLTKIIHHFNGLSIEQELDAFLFGIRLLHDVIPGMFSSSRRYTQ
jgi:hypothetical protein